MKDQFLPDDDGLGPDGRIPDGLMPDGSASDDPVAMPIDGTLDLHMFSPRETRELVPEYLNLCREQGILSVRIIHGKGIGVQREMVHKILQRHPAVVGFGHPGDGGSWGATVVELRPLDEEM